MKSPEPDSPVRGSRTGRPVMALLDLLGRRMTLRILWELTRQGKPMTFRMLQDAAETNPSVLNSRLRELRAARLVDREDRGYVLSEQGDTLLTLLLPLNGWANEWASRFGTSPVAGAVSSADSRPKRQAGGAETVLK
jgi:DNA-binding HxlR family transcriptional regulator